MREEALHTGEPPVVLILSGSHFVWCRFSHCLASWWAMFCFFLDFVHLNLETDLCELYFWPPITSMKPKSVSRSGSCPVWIKMIVLGAGQTGARVGRRKELRSNNDHPLIGLACGQQDGTVILVMVLVNGIGGGL